KRAVTDRRTRAWPGVISRDSGWRWSRGQHRFSVMNMDEMLLGGEYASHLTDADLELLVTVAGRAEAGPRARGAAAGLRHEPGGLAGLLADPRVMRAVLGAPAAWDAPAPVSPFCVFAVAVHGAAAELASLGYVPERT